MEAQVIVGAEKRRSFSKEEKLAIVQESLEPGAVATQVARKHGIYGSQLYKWRKDFQDEKRQQRTALENPGFARVVAEEDVFEVKDRGGIFVYLPDVVAIEFPACSSDKRIVTLMRKPRA